jgi:hypothetical protein
VGKIILRLLFRFPIFKCFFNIVAIFKVQSKIFHFTFPWKHTCSWKYFITHIILYILVFEKVTSVQNLFKIKL